MMGYGINYQIGSGFNPTYLPCEEMPEVIM